ncbi:MAG: hypothetical protein K2J63_05235 [Muribaculaceae bacterium]|nr:hypothetical protein [Muribaculaceae bacterium]MDE6794692.1 hypothetical protein [Muribaculaceae bacterium]
MRHEDQLKDKYGTDPGFRVPDGYFEELNLKIMESLPAYPEAPRRVDMSLWQKVKPYVYLAAMFAGIWMMMKVFHTVSTSESLNLDNPPAAIAQAMATATDEALPYFTTANDYALEEEMTQAYSSIEEFEADFGYDFKPQYASL